MKSAQVEHDLKITDQELGLILRSMQLLHEQLRMAAARRDKVGRYAAHELSEMTTLEVYLRMAAGIDEEK